MAMMMLTTEIDINPDSLMEHYYFGLIMFMMLITNEHCDGYDDDENGDAYNYLLIMI